MKPLRDQVALLVGSDNGEAAGAEDHLRQALGQVSEELRDGAASLLLEALPKAGPVGRRRILDLLQGSWWPPTVALAGRAFRATLAALADLPPTAGEPKPVSLLWAHLCRVDATVPGEVGRALEHPSAAVRKAAAGALGRIGPTGVSFIPALVARLSDPEEAVAQAALEALRTLAPLDPAAALPALGAEISRASGRRRFEALAGLRGLVEGARQGGPALPPPDEALGAALIDSLKDADEGVRLQAAALLGLHGPGGAAVEAALRHTLEDPSAEVAAVAAVSLLRRGWAEAAAVQRLQDQLCAAEAPESAAALTALDGLEEATLRRVRPALEAATGKAQAPVQRAAAELLGRLG